MAACRESDDGERESALDPCRVFGDRREHEIAIGAGENAALFEDSFHANNLAVQGKLGRRK
jgi:hypothetical protein